MLMLNVIINAWSLYLLYSVKDQNFRNTTYTYNSLQKIIFPTIYVLLIIFLVFAFFYSFCFHDENCINFKKYFGKDNGKKFSSGIEMGDLRPPGGNLYSPAFTLKNRTVPGKMNPFSNESSVFYDEMEREHDYPEPIPLRPL